MVTTLNIGYMFCLLYMWYNMFSSCNPGDNKTHWLRVYSINHIELCPPSPSPTSCYVSLTVLHYEILKIGFRSKHFDIFICFSRGVFFSFCPVFKQTHMNWTQFRMHKYCCVNFSNTKTGRTSDNSDWPINRAQTLEHTRWAYLISDLRMVNNKHHRCFRPVAGCIQSVCSSDLRFTVLFSMQRN